MILIIALLYASENGVQGLRAFEYQAIPILREHGGILISALFNDIKVENEPVEIHVIQFPRVENFEIYKNDPRDIHLASLKAEMIRKNGVFKEGGLIIVFIYIDG